MTNCVFCKIIEGELPSAQVYEDDDVLVFLDIAPVNKGHCLVVPKEHYIDALDTPPDVMAKVIQVAQKVGDALIKGVGAEGFNIVVNSGKSAGQVVPHLHFHLVPRKSNDGGLFSGKDF